MAAAIGSEPVKMTVAQFLDGIRVVHGSYTPSLLTVHCVIKDEMFFLPSFLSHYRSLGVRQFVFLDDGSNDGSVEYLAAQPDCILLKCAISYGTKVDLLDASVGQTLGRAGTYFRTLAPIRVGQEGWAIGVDADEFLFLPPRWPDLQSLVEALEERSFETVVSTCVEFYPASIWHEEERNSVETLEHLLQLSPFFDATPLFTFDAAGDRKLIADTATTRLLREFRIREPFPGYFPLSRALRWLMGAPPRTPAAKSPLIKWSEGTFLNAAGHHATAAPPRDLVLAMAHFKFTPDLDRRTRGAIASRAYAASSSRYDCYDALIGAMRRSGASFMGPSSRKLESVSDLVEAGIMVVGDAWSDR